MRRFFRLTFFTLFGKVLSIFILAYIARKLSTDDIAYISIVPSLAILMTSTFSFGVNTLLEKDVPKLMVSDTHKAFGLLRKGMLVNLGAIVLVALCFIFYSDFIGRVIFKSQSSENDFGYLIFPLLGYMAINALSLPFQLTGKVDVFGFYRIYSDMLSKLCAIGFYTMQISAQPVLNGLLIGQLPFVLAALFKHRAWLFNLNHRTTPVWLKWSWGFYLESIVNAVRVWGDTLLISSLFGSEPLANYYVVKRIADQINVLYQPFVTTLVPIISASYSSGMENLRQKFRVCWVATIPLFIAIAACFSTLSPFLIKMIAGTAYMGSLLLAVVLIWGVYGLVLYSISSRILLIIGDSMARFKIALFQVVSTLLCIGILIDYGALGLGASWLAGSAIAVVGVIVKARHYGFIWPSLYPATLMNVMAACWSCYAVLVLHNVNSEMDYLILAVAGNLALITIFIITTYSVDRDVCDELRRKISKRC